jgi:hypothetical protein
VIGELELFSFLPVFVPTQTVGSSGTRLAFRGPSVYAPFWHAVKDIARYDAYFPVAVGTPFIYAADTDYPVGTLLETDTQAGRLLFVPGLAVPPEDATYPDALADFVRALAELVSAVQVDSGSDHAPAWASQYATPQEHDLTETLGVQRAELAELHAHIDALETQVAAAAQDKLLLYAAGTPLVERVATTLEMLGFETQHAPNDTGSLTLVHGDRVGVALVTGETGNADARFATQLEKWVIEYFETHNAYPKGFLVVNAFRDTPPLARTEPAFPESILDYSRNRGHCLLTTAQLLCMVIDARQHPDRRDAIVDTLFGTTGTVDAYHDVAAYLVTPTDTPA